MILSDVCHLLISKERFAILMNHDDVFIWVLWKTLKSKLWDDCTSSQEMTMLMMGWFYEFIQANVLLPKQQELIPWVV